MKSPAMGPHKGEEVGEAAREADKGLECLTEAGGFDPRRGMWCKAQADRVLLGQEVTSIV